MYFHLYCEKYSSPRDSLFTEITTFIPNFYLLNPEEKQNILMGEGAMAPLAAKYVFACHSLTIESCLFSMLVGSGCD
jgi:hypothetical protein